MSPRNDLDDFPNKLKRWYPGVEPRDAMQTLLDTHHTFRAVSAHLRTPLITVFRWAQRFKVFSPTNVPWGVQHQYIIRELVRLGGGDKPPQEVLAQMKEEYKSWRLVASILGVSPKELQKYRYLVKMVPPDPFKDRCNIREGSVDESREIWEQYYKW